LKANSSILIIYILCLTFFSGCAAVNPVATYYENNFADFEASQQDLIKSKSIKKSFSKSFDEVWDNALYILAQHAIIVDASRESGIITYVCIDGVYFGDVFNKDLFYYWEFPFTALIDKGARDITVFVYPMSNLYDERDKKKKWWKIINDGFNQKGEEFIERLSTQLTVQGQWQWLRN
jgi:hypothetical protein